MKSSRDNEGKASQFGRGRALLLFFSLALFLPLAAGTLSRARAQGKEEKNDSIYKQLSVFTEVLSLIRRNYVDETSLDGLFSGALDGTVDALDPLATYVPEEHVEAYGAVREVERSLSGVAVARQRGITYVLTVEPESPGAEAGLAAGDILAEMDGRSTREMSLWEVESLLAQESDTKVELKILRRGQALEKELTLRTFARQGAVLDIRGDTAIITIPRFSVSVPEELAALLRDVQNRDRLLLDLRGAAGGAHESAYPAAAHFVSGILGGLRGRSETLKQFGDERPATWSGKLVLVTDRSTQGASEIFAVVLRQSAGAEIVGERTFGHAARRSVARLSNGDEVHFSDAFYTGPDGETIDSPLVPEVVVSDVSRSLSEADVPFSELVLKRAIERLQADDEDEEAEKAAA